MKKTSLIYLIILFYPNLIAQEADHIGKIRNGSDKDQVQIIHSQIAGEPGNPCGLYISEIDKAVTMLDPATGSLKKFQLLSGNYISTTKTERKVFNQSLWSVYGNGYYYLSYNGTLYVIGTDGTVTNKIKTSWINSESVYFLRGSTHVKSSNGEAKIENKGKYKNKYTINKIDQITMRQKTGISHPDYAYTLYADSLHDESSDSLLKISCQEYFPDGRPADSKIIWQMPRKDLFPYPKYRHGIQMFFAPSGVAYIIADNGQDLEIWRVIPDNIRGHVFVFGYNELPLVDLARRGLDEAPAQADLDFIASLRPEELKVLKAAPFALEGCNFQDQELQRYFETWDWYLPEAKKFAGAGILSPAQQRLVERITTLDISTTAD